MVELGSAADIFDWRRRTVECAGFLEGQSRKAADAADEILRSLEPILRGRAEGVTDTVSELCKDTLQLMLMLRKSSSAYRVGIFEPGRTIDHLVEAETIAMAFEGPPADQVEGCDIAYTLFGALIKESNPALEEQHILEKAHVICWAPRS